ncbi:MAG: DUF362 domain-containing protein [Propionibacteriaceae bacterium]|jgi:uncharacterized Fe-S center protein|nr:DUF362 domain-containing protein [Propionibacteriaceae bacterium]
MTATVYFSSEITPAALVEVYRRLGREAKGKVAVKISTGEPGPRGGNWLDPGLIKDFVQLVDGAIVECCTAYGGRRSEPAEHLRVAAEHGFTAIAPVDIMDAEGEVDLPTHPGGHLTRDIVGAHLLDYDFLVVLSHFKGHVMGGFGGAVKNASIGCASAAGKLNIHSAGASLTAMSGEGSTQDGFLESMAEAAMAVADHFGDRILYLNVANNISVDCDCDGNAAPPTMADLGILGSLDPVALDRATTDLVRQAPDSAEVVERIDSRHGMHTLDQAARLGLGVQDYELVTVG